MPDTTSHRERWLPLIDLARGALRERWQRLAAGARGQETPYVLTTSVGTPWQASNVTHRFQARLAQAGLPRLAFHGLRHGTPTLLTALDVPLPSVQRILGHAQTATTAIYTQVDDTTARGRWSGSIKG